MFTSGVSEVGDSEVLPNVMLYSHQSAFPQVFVRRKSVK